MTPARKRALLRSASTARFAVSVALSASIRDHTANEVQPQHMLRMMDEPADMRALRQRRRLPVERKFHLGLNSRIDVEALRPDGPIEDPLNTGCRPESPALELGLIKDRDLDVGC